MLPRRTRCCPTTYSGLRPDAIAREFSVKFSRGWEPTNSKPIGPTRSAPGPRRPAGQGLGQANRSRKRRTDRSTWRRPPGIPASCSPGSGSAVSTASAPVARSRTIGGATRRKRGEADEELGTARTCCTSRPWTAADHGVEARPPAGEPGRGQADDRPERRLTDAGGVRRSPARVARNSLAERLPAGGSDHRSLRRGTEGRRSSTSLRTTCTRSSDAAELRPAGTSSSVPAALLGVRAPHRRFDHLAGLKRAIRSRLCALQAVRSQVRAWSPRAPPRPRKPERISGSRDHGTSGWGSSPR